MPSVRWAIIHAMTEMGTKGVGVGGGMLKVIGDIMPWGGEGRGGKGRKGGVVGWEGDAKGGMIVIHKLETGSKPV